MTSIDVQTNCPGHHLSHRFLLSIQTLRLFIAKPDIRRPEHQQQEGVPDAALVGARSPTDLATRGSAMSRQYPDPVGSATSRSIRLTSFSHGGGCACKIPPGELEQLMSLLPPVQAYDMVVGPETGDDAAVVRLPGGGLLVSTVDFFSPVVDDPFDWGRIAATNALSDVYAMGGTPIVALNLLGWPRDALPMELAAEVLRGGRVIADAARCPIGGGHSIDDPEPKYGMAVTGTVEEREQLRIDHGEAGLPLTLTKPLGIGVLNPRHKATGEVFPEAIAAMTTLNRDASRAAIAGGARCATDVTGFGLLGHLKKLARGSRVSAVIDRAAVPFLDGAREAVAEGFVSGGTRRNLSWVIDDLDSGGAGEDELLLLADAQTSGGLLVVGEVPGFPIVGELVPAGPSLLSLR
jgi:selenide,water dikinase